MRTLRNRVVPVLLASVVLVGGANIAVYAATGGQFTLGFVNKANRPSTLVNTNTGPALKLKTSDSAPPLAVTSKKKVKRLNADRLDGKHAGAFEPRIKPFNWQTLNPATGWKGNCYTASPAYALRNGVVYFKGDLCATTTGPNRTIFTLPPQARPNRGTVYLTADLCGAATGRIYINPTTGVVKVQTDPDSTSSPEECFVSLEGISYPVN